MAIYSILVYELKENETWNAYWQHIGLYESKELAEEVRIKRETNLRANFCDNENHFSDYYRWVINERELFTKGSNN